MNIFINNDLFVSQKINVYYQMDYNNFIDLFFYKLSLTNNINITENINNATIQIYGIQTTKNTNIRKDIPCLLICNENCSVGRKHYNHFNEFNYFNDERINIYIYNDISNIIIKKNKIAIPFIYLYIDQFIRLEKQIQINNINFKNKKFCLFTSRNLHNKNKSRIITFLSKYGEIDYLSNYNISNISCFHDVKLLQLYNNYKFIICFENSISDGYITEKIFNVFLAKSIPIYNGAPNINNYLNKEAILNINNKSSLIKLNKLISNEDLYNNFINLNKININYNNENWDSLLYDYIKL